MTETFDGSRNAIKFLLGLLVIVHTSHGQLTLQDIRLVDGSNQYEGRVEVKYNNIWGTVCTDGFGDEEAQVICRQLNYAGGTAVTDINIFGEGAGQIWLDSLGCEGDEESLNLCPSNSIGDHDCYHSSDAGVICTEPVQGVSSQSATIIRGPAVAQPSICPGSTDPQIRLVGPNNTVGVGFVEVKFNGIWGAVCDDHWGIQDARVVCGSLCFNKTISLTGASFNIEYVKASVSQTFLLDDVKCTGSETSIFNCQHSGIGISNCQPGEYASVTCTPIERSVVTPPEPDLSCDNDQFTASFSRAFDPGLSYSGVVVDNPEDPCQPKYSNTSAHVIVEISFDQCGTDITKTPSHIIYNITLAYNIDSTDIISRKNFYYVKLTCEFLRNQTNEAGYTAPPAEVTKSSTGEFDVAMLLYEDDNFNQPLSESPTLQMNQPLSASLNLETTLDHLKIVVRTCFATPSGSWADSLHYFLFQDNCEIDDTVTIIPWNETTTGFRFRSFKFVGHTNVYLHCRSLVCEIDEKNQFCDRSCSQANIGGRRRRRRSSRKKRSDYTWLYSVSQLLTIEDKVNDSVIERLPTPGSVSRTIYPTTAKVSVSGSSTVTVSKPTTTKPTTPNPTTTKPTTPKPTTTKQTNTKPTTATRAMAFSTSQPSRSSVEIVPGIDVNSNSQPSKSSMQSNGTRLLDGVLPGDVSSASCTMATTLPFLMLALLSWGL